MGMNRLATPRILVALALLTFAVLGGVLPDAFGQRPDSTTIAVSGGRPSEPVMNTPSVEIDPEDPLQKRIYAEYGAVFVARKGAVPPPKVVFESARDVAEWQSRLETRRARLGKHEIELQRPAMEALLAARDEARKARLDITARGQNAGRRSYEETVRLWMGRVERALEHWRKERRIASGECERIRSLDPRAQIPEVLALEKSGVWFSTDFSKSILYSVAAPGTSQHLSMLAIDVAEFETKRVREILARHGWFQTVVSDLPHFTFLGVDEEELPSLGLKRVLHGGRPFWVPDLAKSELDQTSRE